MHARHAEPPQRLGTAGVSAACQSGDAALTRPFSGKDVCGFQGQEVDSDCSGSADDGHPAGHVRPLAPTLAAYDDFFRITGSFDGFVDFFLLDDLITRIGNVRSLTRFLDFVALPALPQSTNEYRRYRRNAMAFLPCRNDRIGRWARKNLRP
jgi:hypothetical protein